MNLTHGRLVEVLSYEPSTGAFTWTKRLAKKDRTGMSAGSRQGHGYIVIQIDAELFGAHRLAWLYVHGSWPKGQIDHINGIRDDNRLGNLRDIPAALNQQNQRSARKGTSSGFLGVSWHKAAQKWAAQIAANNKKYHLGTFSTPEAAHAAYVAAKRELHPGGML